MSKRRKLSFDRCISKFLQKQNLLHFQSKCGEEISDFQLSAIQTIRLQESDISVPLKMIF